MSHSHSHSHSDGEGDSDGEDHGHSHSHSHQGPPSAGGPSKLPPPSEVEGLINIHALNVLNAEDPMNLAISSQNTQVNAGLAKELEALTNLSRDFARHNIKDAPPPPQTAKNQRSNLVMHAKEEGNTLYKKGNYPEAINKYSIAAHIAGTRPLFEAAVYAREELALTLCNRCAAYTSAGKLVEALADAEAVIKLKRPWTKGHFRKGKCLAAMGKYDEAKEAFLLGLEFEPAEKDLIQALEDVKKQKLAAREKETSLAVS